MAEKCVWYINQLKTDDKPAAVAVPSFVFTSKVKEVSIATPWGSSEIATVSWATPSLSKTDTAVST